MVWGAGRAKERGWCGMVWGAGRAERERLVWRGSWVGSTAKKINIYHIKPIRSSMLDQAGSDPYDRVGVGGMVG